MIYSDFNTCQHILTSAPPCGARLSHFQISAKFLRQETKTYYKKEGALPLHPPLIPIPVSTRPPHPSPLHFSIIKYQVYINTHVYMLTHRHTHAR